MELFIVSLLLILLVQYNNAEVCKNNGAEVKYYEKLIKSSIIESLTYKTATSADEYRPTSNHVEDFGLFDFIVVGSGAGGAVMASRLSEIKKWNILLLEAGDDIDDFANIPGVSSYLYNSRYNWNFTTTPQTRICLGNPGRRCAVTRGKALGGSSCINGANYIRGNKETFNQWERDGNKGWAYKSILPYFIKSENCQIDGDPDYHGKGGYSAVRNIPSTNVQVESLMEASTRLFNYTATDYNGKCQLGMFLTQANGIRGQRQSIARAFLIPFEKRKNLFILRHAYATKILIENKTARGVEFAYNGTLFHATIKKEVILSAGGIQSPQLLMLSGVGSKNDLKRLNISLIKDLPVGYNTHEQPIFRGIYIRTNYTAPAQTLKDFVEDYLRNEGELTTADGSHAMGFYQSSYGNVSGLPNIRLTIGQSSTLNEVFENISNTSTGQIINKHIFSVLVGLLNPLSLGRIVLESKDPYRYPMVDPNYFSNEQDREVMYEGVQLIQRLIDTPEMQTLNASFIFQNYPQCRKYTNQSSKDYWFCAFRYSLTSLAFEGMGSCKMGCNSKTSVVNNNLQVHGIEKLRVVDASVIPTPSVGIFTTVVVMAERISDIIKRLYNERVEPITNVFGYNN